VCIRIPASILLLVTYRLPAVPKCLSAFLLHARIRLSFLVKNALLCTEASRTASAAILVGIQGDTSFTAAAFSLLTDIATSAAVVSVEDYVGAYAVAAEVLR
jgi:hypothetical protein